MNEHKYKTIGSGVWVGENVVFGKNVVIGHCACIGYGNDHKPTIIGDNVIIGAFSTIEGGSKIKDNVKIDCYCRIGYDAVVGENSRILASAYVYENVTIGKNCIIGGDLVDRVIVEDNVTYFGVTAHRYENPNVDWETTDEPSPRILAGSVIGEKALIIGDVTIGPQAYVGAGEVVRTNIPEMTVLLNGKYSSVDSWRGIIKVRPRK